MGLARRGLQCDPGNAGTVPGFCLIATTRWGGGTNPMAAMSVAIAYRPERIVLLSDGEFDTTCSTTITMMNKQYGKSARIDCVGLMENVRVLRDIAAQNKGTYYQAW